MSADTVITCHVNADNDALASLVGALALYPGAVLLFPGSQEKQVQEFYEDVVEPLYPCISQKELDTEAVKRLVVVDTHLRSRISPVKRLLEEKPGLEIHVWDHHGLSDDEGEDRLPASLMRVEKVGAASTVIVEELRRRGLPVTCETATALAAGIYGDTGSFLYNSTTKRDLEAAAWLAGLEADLAVVSRLITRTMGREQLHALSVMLENTQLRDIGGVLMAISSMQSETFLEDFATLAPRIMEIEGCSVLFAVASMEDKVQVVGRSNSPMVDVGEICRRIGGGGHHYAASASVKDMTLPQVRDFLKMQASLLVNADENAGKLMTSPALGASERLTIGEAQSLMIRYGLKAVPIFAEGTRRCLGLLAQETAAKASGHGLAQIGVTMYMQRSFSVVPKSAGIQELVDIMIGGRQRLIPVVDGEDVEGLEEEERAEALLARPVVGVVTRTDIIRLFMGENGAHIPPVSRKARKERSLASAMGKRLPQPCLDFLRLAGEIAEDRGAAVYVVGGFVRDLVMDKGLKWPDIDVDLVIEGDAMAFAHSLAIHLKGRVREHREFMTAMLVFPAESLCRDVKQHRRTHLAEPTEIKVDIATARLEFYAEPGALPQVERGSIKMDLYRRDFSINAMAIRLNPPSFGQLVDFFDGQEDIRNKRIRTLHALSFVEDPTRMFRAVRFEQRYGFRMGAQCERFMRNAIDDLHLIHHLSGSRICHELELMMEERNPFLAFRRMDELGLLAEVHPLLAMNDEKRDMADRVRRVLEWYMRMYLPEVPDLLMLMVIALCRRAPGAEVEQLLDRLQFSDRRKRETMLVRSSIMAVRQGMTRWEKADGPLSELHRMLGRAPLETLLYLLAREDKPELHEKLTRYIYLGRQMKADINGDDLKHMGVEPGPMIGRILNEVLTVKMDNESMSREDQLALAARLAVQYTAEAVAEKGRTLGEALEEAGEKAGQGRSA
ncbi:DHHA1 domain-containing protein [Mailhella massiliensis]|uniref:CBS domain-containing protein n=1 Tax=Mailhella massiliensis TaxID=1903261 RepID=A0A921DS66_9BACT|nr:DHHA1 domain-containing protein [Mailhella massiliensis]HJD97851.1 CBS domain-containing protein [Mailhella massiliensis]